MDISTIFGCRQSYAPNAPHVKSRDIKALEKILRKVEATPGESPILQSIRNDRISSLKKTVEHCLKVVNDNLYTHDYGKVWRLEKLATKTDKLFNYNALTNEETGASRTG